MAESTQFQPIITTNLTTLMADGQTESSAIDLSGTTLAALSIPAEFEGASISLKAAIAANGNFVSVYDAKGIVVSFNAAANRFIVIEPALMAGLQHIKLVSNVAQSGDATITLLTRPI